MDAHHLRTRYAWIFERGSECVVVIARHGQPGCELLIQGPGLAAQRLAFESEDLLHRFQEHHEEQLIAQGYVLTALRQDRRSGRDRRAAQRSHDRRRSATEA